MALIRTGPGIIDIRGTFAGIYFSRDKTGLHIRSHPRHISMRSLDQAAQRNAFAAAQAYSTDPRFVSFNIYRALNGLPLMDPPVDYRPDLK